MFKTAPLLKIIPHNIIYDPNDDIKRELALWNIFWFLKNSYEASVKATMEGRKKLKENGIPYLRPEDYLAEMVKDDKKMKMIDFFCVWKMSKNLKTCKNDLFLLLNT